MWVSGTGQERLLQTQISSPTVLHHRGVPRFQMGCSVFPPHHISAQERPYSPLQDLWNLGLEWKEGMIRAPSPDIKGVYELGSSDVVTTHLWDKIPPPVLMADGGWNPSWSDNMAPYLLRWPVTPHPPKKQVKSFSSFDSLERSVINLKLIEF